MKRKLAFTGTATEDDLIVDLTFHDVPAALLTEFAEKIVGPYYRGNLNQALRELMGKAITEQDFLLNHVKERYQKQILR